MLKKSLAAGAVVAATTGVLLVGAPAYAADDATTSGNGSVLSGNQTVNDNDTATNICGNATAVFGVANANCENSGAAVVD